MAKQTIGIGATANDGTGDPLRTAFDKTNDNFDELYTHVVVDVPATNLFVGVGAGNDAYSTMAGCIFIGPNCGIVADTSNDSIGIGSECMKATTGGVGNTAIGRLALSDNVTGGNNTALGDSVLRDCLTDLNTGMGYITMQAVTTGTLNTGIGAGVALVLTTGSNNTMVGANSMYSSITGAKNAALGVYTLYNATTDDNVAVGFQALYTATNPGNSVGENVAIGTNAGFTVTTGYRNTFVGANCGNNASQAVGVNNSTAIGNTAYTTKTNQVVLGNSAVVETLIRGDVIFTGLLASTTPANNGELVIEKTANTTLTLKLKGSDGTVRSVALTLA